MQKRALLFSVLSTTLPFFMISPSYAQAFFGATSKPAATVMPGTNKVMSSDDFKSMVNNLSQQNKADLSQQVTQQVKQAPSQPIMPSMARPNAPATVSSKTPEAPQSPAISAPPKPPTNQAVSAPASMPPNRAIMAPAPSVYTGFGVDNSKKPSQPANTDNNSGGFQINY